MTNNQEVTSVNWLEKKSFDADDILRVLPHRFPFLMVDRVLEITSGKPLSFGLSAEEQVAARKGSKSRALKNVTFNEMQFLGHFPDHPIFPGVLTLEALAQSAAFTTIPFVALASGGALPPLKVALASFDKVRFRRPIRPGDQMQMTVTVKQTKGAIWNFEGLVEVDGKCAAEGEFMAQLQF